MIKVNEYIKEKIFFKWKEHSRLKKIVKENKTHFILKRYLSLWVVNFDIRNDLEYKYRLAIMYYNNRRLTMYIKII